MEVGKEFGDEQEVGEVVDGEAQFVAVRGSFDAVDDVFIGGDAIVLGEGDELPAVGPEQIRHSSSPKAAVDEEARTSHRQGRVRRP